MPSPCLPLNGPLRIEKWPGAPAHSIVVNRLGVFQCDGPYCVVSQIVEAFNSAHKWPDLEEQPSKVQPCECGYPIEEEGQEKCVSCRHPLKIGIQSPAPPEPKKTQVATMDEWM